MRDAAIVRRSNRIALRGEIGRDQPLLSILSAADVEEVVRGGVERVADPHRPHVELVPATGRSPRENRDVPAVGVDVEVLGVEVTDA